MSRHAINTPYMHCKIDPTAKKKEEKHEIELYIPLRHGNEEGKEKKKGKGKSPPTSPFLPFTS